MPEPDPPPAPALPASAPGARLHLELGKRHPFEHAEQEAVLNIIRTASLLTAQITRLTRAHGLSQSGYNVLRILRGSRPNARACHEIGGELVVAVPDVTRLVDRLQQDGLVRRLRCSADRRVVRVEITEAGLERLAELDQPMIELHRRQLRHMPEDALRMLSALLVQVRHPDDNARDPSADSSDPG